jgi:hypothetical protein
MKGVAQTGELNDNQRSLVAVYHTHLRVSHAYFYRQQYCYLAPGVTMFVSDLPCELEFP